MALLTQAELKTLAEMQVEPCISIFMPTHMAGQEIRQDPIRLKNHLSDVRQRLDDVGFRDTNVEKMLQPAYDLLEMNDFWRHQKEGLALFIAPDFFRFYRLPLEFENHSVVSDRMHIKPILPMLTGDGYFYLLAFSQNRVRLFQGTHYTMSEVELDDMPNSLAEALKYDDPEEQLRFHAASRGGSPANSPGTGLGSPEGGAPAYHGQGVGTTDDKNAILRFCQKIDNEISSFLSGEEAPLVVAAVDYVIQIYQEANSYPHLLDEGIPGNPDVAKPDALHQQAWKLVKPHFKQSQNAAFHAYRDMSDTNEASDHLEEVIKAAYERRIETLFVRADQHRWGQFNTQTQDVEFHDEEKAEDTDLLDFAAVQTMLNGGKVFAIKDEEQMPSSEPVAAILRY